MRLTGALLGLVWTSSLFAQTPPPATEAKTEPAAKPAQPEKQPESIWTRKTLTESSKSFLSGLPEKIDAGQVTLTHGSPRHPVWEYLLDTRTATINFEYFETLLCFVGHTHLPVIYSLHSDNHVARLSIPEPDQPLELIHRAIVNPGSVGQPRDRDPRASYAIYNDETHLWDYRQVHYDISAVQKRMVEAGLPERHIQRLSAGW